MRLGMIFPDAAAFYRKMGMEIFENYPDVKKLYQKAKSAAQLDMKKSLIYEQTEGVWDEKTKNIAVLLTSVGFYRTWYERYKITPKVFFGNGVGVLSALVCAGTISVSNAIRMIRKDSWKLPLGKKADGKVYVISSGKTIDEDEREPEARYNVPFGERQIQMLLQYAWDEEIDSILEIGPNNGYTKVLEKFGPYEGIQIAYLDDSNDNAYILENFEYRKHFNHLYVVRRLLGVAAATQNHNGTDEEKNTQIVESYNMLRAYIDDMLKKEYMGKDASVSDYDLQLCVEELKKILRLKGTPAHEVQQRVLGIENETLVPLQQYFEEWF